MISISMHNTGINIKWQEGGIFALLCCCWRIDPGVVAQQMAGGWYILSPRGQGVVAQQMAGGRWLLSYGGQGRGWWLLGTSCNWYVYGVY